MLALGREPIRLSWRVTGDPAPAQLAYEVEAATDRVRDAARPTGVVDGRDQVAVAGPGPALRSREVRYYRVRIRTADGLDRLERAVLRIEAGSARLRPTGRPGDHAWPTTRRGRASHPSPLLRQRVRRSAAASRGAPAT